jgi:hypothetical protein
VNVSELVIRESVRDTVFAYADAGDRLRLDDLAATFTETGVLEVADRWRAEGRDAIRRALARPAPDPGTTEGGPPRRRPSYVRHFVTNLRFLSVTEAEVRATAYFQVITDVGPDHWGRYRDVLAPSEGRWLFRERYVRVDGGAPGSLFV